MASMPTSGRIHLMRTFRRAAATLLALVMTRGAGAQEAPARAIAAPPDDPVLARLIAQSLAARPGVRQAEEIVRAERERIPQAGALPDPMLTLGIQNDGFRGIEVGKMETSYYQVMASQGIPWPGKRSLRGDVASLGAKQAESSVSRARLTTEADARRAYLGLVLARDRLALLDRLVSIWQKSAGIARTRYEAGDGAQSDVLRAQLELNRLRQRRFALEAEVSAQVQALNRLRGRPLDEAIATTASVHDLGAPVVPQLDAATADAMERSPELAAARLGVARAQSALDLARRERYPDFTVSAGIMPRGSLDPMWLASVGVTLPIWSARKQGRAVDESAARASAEASAAAEVEQILRLRVAERRTALASLAETIRLYRDGLLIQSQATADSTLAQYRVGKVTFASVLEANAGYISDEEGYLVSAAEAERIAIAGAEVSLDSIGVTSEGGGAMGGGGIPGAGPSARSGGMGRGGGAAPAQAGESGSANASSM